MNVGASSAAGGGGGEGLGVGVGTRRRQVWRAGHDALDEREELEYDPSAYDCLHDFQLDWPSLSFDFLRDERRRRHRVGRLSVNLLHVCASILGRPAWV